MNFGLCLGLTVVYSDRVSCQQVKRTWNKSRWLFFEGTLIISATSDWAAGCPGFFIIPSNVVKMPVILMRYLRTTPLFWGFMHIFLFFIPRAVYTKWSPSNVCHQKCDDRLARVPSIQLASREVLLPSSLYDLGNECYDAMGSTHFGIHRSCTAGCPAGSPYGLVSSVSSLSSQN